MKKRRVIGWILLVWGAVAFVVDVFIWLPRGRELWHSAAHDPTQLNFAVLNIIGCIVFMIVGARLIQKAARMRDLNV